MTTSSHYSQSSPRHWNNHQSDWKHSIRDAMNFTNKAGGFVERCLARCCEVLAIAFMLVGNLVCAVSGLVAIPVLAIAGLCAFVLAMSGSIMAFGTVLEFFGLA